MAKNRKQKKSRTSKKGSNGVLHTRRPNITNMYLERSRFPAIPREIEFALHAYYHDERTGGQTTQAERVTPLCEFNTILPRFGAELYQIYRHARIMAIDIRMEIVNTSSTEPLIAAIGCLPLVNCNALTSPQTIASVPGTKFRQVGLSTGMSRTTISHRFVTERMLGELTIGSNTYLQTYSEALSAAVWTELPAIYAGVIAARNGASWTGIIDYQYTYHIRFSELNIPALGLGLEESIKMNYPLPKGLQQKQSKTLHRKIQAQSEEDQSEDERSNVEWVPMPPLPKLKKTMDSSVSRLSTR